MTFLGQPVTFTDQVLYFQSKSVLEVFQTLINVGRPDMYLVGVLVLTFSVIFPVLKIFTLTLGLYRPALLRENRLARFLGLESSKWSMADVMALAIFMTYVAFNGLLISSMGALQETGTQLVIPTDGSKVLPGYYLFIGFCLASLVSVEKAGARNRDWTRPETELRRIVLERDPARINLRKRRLLVPLTASSRSRLGDKPSEPRP